MSQERTVLFLGRITEQKGPRFFVDAASLVISKLGYVKKRDLAASGSIDPAVLPDLCFAVLARKKGRALRLTSEFPDGAWQTFVVLSPVGVIWPRE